MGSRAQERAQPLEEMEEQPRLDAIPKELLPGASREYEGQPNYHEHECRLLTRVESAHGSHGGNRVGGDEIKSKTGDKSAVDTWVRT